MGIRYPLINEPKRNDVLPGMKFRERESGLVFTAKALATSGLWSVEEFDGTTLSLFWADLFEPLSESPPADPLAGVDWSRYLPKDGDPHNDQKTDYRVGDICAARWAEGRCRAVFKVEHCDGSIRGSLLASNEGQPTGAETICFTAGFAVEIGLIARDGKLVVQSEKEKRAEPVAKLLEGKKVELPRAHDFTNPYLRRRESEVRLCVECGHNNEIDNKGICTPVVGWREEHDQSMAAQMLRREMRGRLIPRCPASHRPDVAYRNDVAGIGAVLGGYLNVAPERGR